MSDARALQNPPTRKELEAAFDDAQSKLEVAIQAKKAHAEAREVHEDIHLQFEGLEDKIHAERDALREAYRKADRELSEQLDEIRNLTRPFTYRDSVSARALIESEDPDVVVAAAAHEKADAEYREANAKWEALELASLQTLVGKREPKTPEELEAWFLANQKEVLRVGAGAGGNGHIVSRLSKTNLEPSKTGRPIVRMLDGSGVFRLGAPKRDRWTESSPFTVYARIGFKGELVGVIVTESVSGSTSYWGGRTKGYTDAEYRGVNGTSYDCDGGVKSLALKIGKAEKAASDADFEETLSNA